MSIQWWIELNTINNYIISGASYCTFVFSFVGKCNFRFCYLSLLFAFCYRIQCLPMRNLFSSSYNKWINSLKFWISWTCLLFNNFQAFFLHSNNYHWCITINISTLNIIIFLFLNINIPDGNHCSIKSKSKVVSKNPSLVNCKKEEATEERQDFTSNLMT